MGNTNYGNDCQRTWQTEKQGCLMVAFIFGINNRGEDELYTRTMAMVDK
ncbi:hypothetical protein SeD_A0616 [Salmonella enterica subsp. enterica serovar Dublin str. CT_02021853]|uniref:Uncharacterized protein n=2 Tax=Salmonella dublin TaxID=98360 RepID=A0A8X6JYV0_SALDU|nr:hypothetical protein SeD_A0616 [Salmonella enterica subsp. enterica serovar Dublin str. CT_02021853]EGE28615.1 hypothetical protein SD3246_0602 [Salmonella enterica subsp. enterica serovar Dublin str. SD3246]CDS65396.1 unnamed protein product [Salmonella enterica subsp. enterica serovar Dublin]